MLRKIVSRVFLYLLVLLTGVHHCLAQVYPSALNRTVKDVNGRRIAGARIVAMQLHWLCRETVSSVNGSYDLLDLPIGAYRVTYSARGFQDVAFAGL